MTERVRVSLGDVRRAAETVTELALRTPMEGSRWLSALTGSTVLLKCENLQRTGSFKVRGAYTRMSRLSEDERARGVVAASAGNHAQGVALAAQALGIKATVFMPEGAPIPKEKATREYGAEVVFHGRYIEDSLAEAGAFAERTGAILIHPFDNADIVAGQGTCGLEILDQAPGVETVVVPTGGGGLPGRRSRGVPPVLGRRTPGRAGLDVDHGRRHRRRVAG
jgi:threonine dehydratase